MWKEPVWPNRKARIWFFWKRLFSRRTATPTERQENASKAKARRVEPDKRGRKVAVIDIDQLSRIEEKVPAKGDRIKRVTSRNGLASFDVDETALVTPLLNPNNGTLMGYWVSNGYDDNFTYNDLYHTFNKSRTNGIKVHPSDQQGILDETYAKEHHKANGGTFYWLTSVAANFAEHR